VTCSLPPVAILLLVSALGCGAEDAETGGSAAPPAAEEPTASRVPTPPDPSESAGETLEMEGLLNGGFEWICDDTTDPPKYGAYWKGAFVYRPGDPTDLIEESDDAAEGRRFLRLAAGHEPVLQKIVADPRWTDRARVELSFRSHGGAGLDVTLEDGPGRRTVIALPAPEGPGWQTHELSLGKRFAAEHGAQPTPRLNLLLSCRAPDVAPGAGPWPSVDVDAVSVSITMPNTSAGVLADEIMSQARRVLRRWYEPESAGGLGLIDLDTGYNLVRAFDVVTGDDRVPATSVGIHSIHMTLLIWLELAHAQGWQDDIATWTPHLQRFVETLVEHHFNPDTGLPRLVDLSTREPLDDAVVTVGAYVEFMVRALALLDDDELALAATERVRAAADCLVRLDY